VICIFIYGLKCAFLLMRITLFFTRFLKADNYDPDH